LSILELAGTFGLRETMSIFLFDRLNSKHLLVKTLGLLLLALFSSVVHGLEIGNPQGLQQIGKRLDLQSNVRGIPQGTESQLRSTCLKAHARPSGRQGVDAFEGLGSEGLQVEFVPTVLQGGVIQFKSRAPVNDALVELELISDCPLLAFKSSWMLIMEPEQLGPKGADSETTALDGAQGFDFRNSSLLKASRVAPKRTSLPVAVSKEPATQNTPPSSNPDPWVEAVVDGNVSPSLDSEHVPLQVAAIDPGFSGQGLIESRPSLSSPVTVLPNESSSLSWGLDFASPAVWIFLVSLLLLFLLSVAFGKSRFKQFRLSKTGAAKVEPADLSAQALFKDYSDRPGLDDSQPSEAPDSVPAYVQDRVLESLMGTEERAPEETYDGLKPLSNLDSMETQSRSSLSICLELINKADIRVWNLPTAYEGLVASRNKSLDLHRTADALLLRCQVGLVELAFQEARRSRRLPDNIADELLNVVIGNHGLDLGSAPALGVPDILKSHVRAKMCEISGAEKRSLLQDNLINLNVQVSNPGLCFGSNAWREFLSEEGILE